MNGVVANTDFDWYLFLRDRSYLDEVNFWRPGTTAFRALAPGEPFFFKLKAPQNAIAGFGLYAGYSLEEVWRSWELFGDGNGAPTQWDLLKRLDRLSGQKGSLSATRKIGCIAVVDPVFFTPDEWVAAPADWSPNIVANKKYDLSSGEGLRIHRECLERATTRDSVPEWAEDMNEEIAKYGKATMIRPRLGQGTFRLAVLSAYDGACAVTTEHSRPAVDAAHIRPYHRQGDHRVSNGMPLRRDIHSLFDAGYVTVTPDHRFRVSDALDSEFANGKTYYAMENQRILLPNDPDLRPDPEALAWHSETVFKG
ncbi:MAG: HNH endonuclease [Solirubrobacterales bacterium]|nr:HNH endonuclease [Solirubrobacterales bacterium]